MKKFISTVFLIIMIIILIAVLTVCGMIAYTEINKDDVIVRGALTTGYNVINEALQSTINKIYPNQNEDPYSLDNVENLGNMLAELHQEKYYYKQLDKYSQMIYDKLDQNKEYMKTGTYEIEFGDIFTNVLKDENGSELLERYYQSAIETYMYDNPEIFYLNPKKMYINIQTTKGRFSTKYEVFLNCGDNENYYADGYSSRAQVEIAEQKIENVKKEILAKVEGKSNYEKLRIIHDYLVDNISYDETLSRNDIYNIYGALVNKKCVCEGYAKAFKYLVDEIQIQNIIVIGVATNTSSDTENHAWNYVELNGKWYAVDVTWDDPIIKGWSYLDNKTRYKYFLVGNKVMQKDHKANTQFTNGGQEYQYPIIEDGNYR